MPDFQDSINEFLREHHNPNETLVTAPHLGKRIASQFENIRIWVHPAVPPDTIYFLDGVALDDLKKSLIENGWP